MSSSWFGSVDLVISAGCFVGSAVVFVRTAALLSAESSTTTTAMRGNHGENDEGGRPRQRRRRASSSWARRKVRRLLLSLLESDHDDEEESWGQEEGAGDHSGRRSNDNALGDGIGSPHRHHHDHHHRGRQHPPPPPEEDHPYVVRRVYDRLSFHEYEEDETEEQQQGDNQPHDGHDNSGGDVPTGSTNVVGQGVEQGPIEGERNTFGETEHERHFVVDTATAPDPRMADRSTQPPREDGMNSRRSDIRRGWPRPASPTLRVNTGVSAANDDPAGNETDYYPKNANWSHFDLTELLQHQLQEQQQQQVPSLEQAQATEEEIVEQDDPPLEPAAHDDKLMHPHMPHSRSAVVTSSSSTAEPLSPFRRQASLEGDYGGRRRKMASPEPTEFVWNDASVKHWILPTDRTSVAGSGIEPPPIASAVPSPPPPCTLPTVPSQTELHCPASPPRPRAVAPVEAPASESLPIKPARTGFPMVRAESLDDRTVWGSLQHLSRPSSPDLDDEFATPTVATPTTLSSTRLASRLSSSTFSRSSSAGMATTSRLSSRPTSSAALSRRSTSVPNLTHLHNLSQHPPPTAPHPSIRDYDRDLTASVRRQNVRARALYNACIMPHSVILIRHGQSMGNTNEELYSTIPDNAMPLTELGWEQARASGRHLRAMLLEKNQSPHFIVSPYTRAVETFHGLASAWCDPNEFKHIRDRGQRLAAWYSRLLELGLTWHEDPRIREQDFGNYQNASVIRQAKKDRHRFGAFYYRFPHGESASDVFDRISTFLDSLWRSFDVNKSRVYVIVTHGIAIRVLLARYFRYTISQFSMLANPRNCEMVVLRHDGRGKLQLYGRFELEMEQRSEEDGDADKVPRGRGETHVVGVRFHRRLRVLPPEYIRTVPIRISYDDDLSS